MNLVEIGFGTLLIVVWFYVTSMMYVTLEYGTISHWPVTLQLVALFIGMWLSGFLLFVGLHFIF